MRIAITGPRGRLAGVMLKLGAEPIDVDVTDKEALKVSIEQVRPDVIIHAAAVTDVDGCEREEIFQKARNVAIRGTRNILDCFKGQVIYISTDYVFDGKSGPYSESKQPDPISSYGFSKWAGELIMHQFGKKNDVVVRTTILYGGNKPDFVTKVTDKCRKGEAFEVPTKLYGSPTYVNHLARALYALCGVKAPPKIINIAGSDVLSRYQFALKIAEVFGCNSELLVPSMDEPDGEASRPLRAGLKVDLARKIGLPIYSAEDGLLEMRNAGNYRHS